MNKCLECNNELNQKWQTKFCSVACSCRYKAKKRREKSIENYYKNPNVCKKCGEIIRLKEHQRVGDIIRQNFCSRKCAGTYNTKGKIRKSFCINWGNTLNKKTQRKYCSQRCQTEYRKEKYIKKWLNGEENGMSGQGISNYIRAFMLERSNHKCEICGWNKTHPKTGNIPLQIDHIDGNSQNNNIENLRVLCPNCHSLTDTFGALNYGNGKRRK